MINNKNNQSFTILNVALSGVFLALFLILYYLNQLIPTPPPLSNFFIKFPLHYIPLIVATTFLMWPYTIILFIICAFSPFFMPSVIKLNFWQFLLDYSIPIFVSILFKLFIFRKLTNKYTVFGFQLLGIFVIVFLGYWSKVISGALYWFNPEMAKPNDTSLTYSLWFNSIALSVELLILWLIIPIILKITNIFAKKYWEN